MKCPSCGKDDVSVLVKVDAWYPIGEDDMPIQHIETDPSFPDFEGFICGHCEAQWYPKQGTDEWPDWIELPFQHIDWSKIHKKRMAAQEAPS